MNRTYLLSAAVVVALVSVVVAIFGSGSQEQTARQQNAKPAETKNVAKAGKTDTATVRKTTKAKSAQKQVAVKNKSKTKTTTTSSKVVSTDKESESRVARVRWPGMKYRMVRVRKEEKIEPVTELRSWSRQQWVNKVTELRKAENDEQAEKYITAYNKQYPKKDLNNYLK